jgi:DNA polymerase-3 subunit delta
LGSLAETRLFLFYGPEESASRALVARVAAALGAEAERIDLDAPGVKADPARLADEAAAFSMFGGPRYIVVDRAGDDLMPAVESLMALPAAGNPVILLAGDLKKSSALVKLATAEVRAIGVASYPVEARDAAALVENLARPLGLTLGGDVARRIAADCAGNRGIIAGELEKYALFLDAASDAPKPLGHDTIDAVGAEAEEGDLGRLAASVAGGNAAAAEAELSRLRAEGKEGITLVRALLRRMTMLARLRAEVERGKSVGTVMASAGKAVFWKEQDAVAREIGRWPAAGLARAIGRLVEAEKRIMSADGPGVIAADAELLAIARQAGRAR